MEVNEDLEASIEYTFEDICELPLENFTTNEEEDESVWTKEAVEILLEECLKKQKEFHNPRHRRNKLFSGIRECMLERGFVFSVKILEKKFYNLKKQFYTMCKSRERDCKLSRPISWPYYTQMMQMFADELEIEEAPTMASLYPDIPMTTVINQNTKVQQQPRDDQDSQNSKTSNDSEYKYTGGEESRWEHKTVTTFLEECCKKKHELWDPKIRRRKIFDEIRRRLKEKGFIFYQESLDRKLRNMKKQFQLIYDAAQRKKINRNGRRRKITWPYYEKLMELYGRELERDIRPESPCQSSEVAKTTLKFRPIAPKRDESGLTSVNQNLTVPALEKNGLPDAIALKVNPSDASSLDEEIPPTDSEHDEEKLKFLRKILAFEERRTIVAEEMVGEMIESNKIRERRLEFKRIKLEYIMRRRRKRNGEV